MRPAISIICPIYNMQASLHKCVDSLLAQSFPDFEILLIDDGSTDRSGAICDEYAAEDIRIRVFHKENGGVSSARQCGIDNACGEYTIHADPDDWADPTMIEVMYRKAKETDADMVIADYYVNTIDGQAYEIQKPTALDHVSVLHDLFIGLHGNCWNKLIRRTCYSVYGVTFPVNISFREDFCVMVQLLIHPIKIAYVNQAFYHYVRDLNQASIANAVNEKKLHDQLTVIDIIRFHFNGAYSECLNILRTDVACWLIETGFRTPSEVRHDFQDLLFPRVFFELPGNRQIKIFVSFFLGRNISVRVHGFISKIKSFFKA